MTLQDLLYVKK
jgi:cGMP-dependent protein kinase